jgi:hypothetical protein
MQSGFRKAQLKVEEGLHRLRGMFDESYDVDMAINIARTNEQADQGKIEQQRKTNLDQSEQQRQQDLGRIGSEFEAEKKALDQAAQAAQDQRRQQYQKQINESMSALEAARKEYRSSLDEAAQKRRESDAAKPTAQPSGIDDLLNRLAGLGDTLEAVGERTEVRGTFNAAAIQSLMGTRTQDRIAAATEQTANHTKRLVDAARSGGLAFE